MVKLDKLVLKDNLAQMGNLDQMVNQVLPVLPERLV